MRDIVDLEATYDMSDINDNKIDDTLKLIEEAGASEKKGKEEINHQTKLKQNQMQIIKVKKMS